MIKTADIIRWSIFALFSSHSLWVSGQNSNNSPEELLQRKVSYYIESKVLFRKQDPEVILEEIKELLKQPLDINHPYYIAAFKETLDELNENLVEVFLSSANNPMSGIKAKEYLQALLDEHRKYNYMKFRQPILLRFTTLLLESIPSTITPDMLELLIDSVMRGDEKIIPQLIEMGTNPFHDQQTAFAALTMVIDFYHQGRGYCFRCSDSIYPLVETLLSQKPETLDSASITKILEINQPELISIFLSDAGYSTLFWISANDANKRILLHMAKLHNTDTEERQRQDTEQYILQLISVVDQDQQKNILKTLIKWKESQLLARCYEKLAVLDYITWQDLIFDAIKVHDRDVLAVTLSPKQQSRTGLGSILAHAGDFLYDLLKMADPDLTVTVVNSLSDHYPDSLSDSFDRLFLNFKVSKLMLTSGLDKYTEYLNVQTEEKICRYIYQQLPYFDSHEKVIADYPAMTAVLDTLYEGRKSQLDLDALGRCLKFEHQTFSVLTYLIKQYRLSPERLAPEMARHLYHQAVSDLFLLILYSSNTELGKLDEFFITIAENLLWLKQTANITEPIVSVNHRFNHAHERYPIDQIMELWHWDFHKLSRNIQQTLVNHLLPFFPDKAFLKVIEKTLLNDANDFLVDVISSPVHRERLHHIHTPLINLFLHSPELLEHESLNILALGCTLIDDEFLFPLYPDNEAFCRLFDVQSDRKYHSHIITECLTEESPFLFCQSLNKMFNKQPDI